MNQSVAARLRHGSIMTSTPSTRRQLDGVVLWSITTRSSQQGRVLAERGLSEEFSGAPDSLFDLRTGDEIIDETDVYVDVDNHVKVDGRSKFVRTGALISSRRHRRDAPTHRGFARRISRSFGGWTRQSWTPH